MIPPELADSPIVLYVLGGLGLFAIAAAAFRKESDKWGAWVAERRRAAVSRDDARVTDLTGDVQYLHQAVNVLRRDLRARDELARIHSQWDHAMILRILKMDPTADFPSPPSLIPITAEPWPEPPPHTVVKPKQPDPPDPA